MSVTPEFELATLESKKLRVDIPPYEVLPLYALYKVAYNVDIVKAPKTWVFGEESIKRKAWKKLVDEKMTPEQAQEGYIKLMEERKTQYGGVDPDKKTVFASGDSPIAQEELERFEVLSRQLGRTYE